MKMTDIKIEVFKEKSRTQVLTRIQDAYPGPPTKGCLEYLPT
jgi:hypothetical protein